jgi:hypothetical protein
MHKAAIQSHHERWIGARQRIPVSLTTFNEGPLLLTEFTFHPFSRARDMSANTSRIQRIADGQDLAENVYCQTIGQQSCKLRLQIHQLGRGAFRKHSRQGLKLVRPVCWQEQE